jgi:transposase
MYSMDSLTIKTTHAIKPSNNISDQMKKAVRTMKKHRSFVDNAITYPFSNGLIEGINNKIKVIKRIAFGYRSFVHFKNRILITQNMVKLKTA